MLLSLIQNSSAGIANTNLSPQLNQQQFLDWLLELYNHSQTRNTSTGTMHNQNLEQTDTNVSPRSPLSFNSTSVLSANILRPQPQKTISEENGNTANERTEVTNDNSSLHLNDHNINTRTLSSHLLKKSLADVTQNSNSTSNEKLQTQPTSLPSEFQINNTCESKIKNPQKSSKKASKSSKKDHTNNKVLQQIEQLLPEIKLNKKKRKTLKRLLRSDSHRKKIYEDRKSTDLENKIEPAPVVIITNENKSDDSIETAIDFLQTFAQQTDSPLEENFSEHEKIFFNQVSKENRENYEAVSVAFEDSALTNLSGSLKQLQSTRNKNTKPFKHTEYKFQESSASSEEFEDAVFIKPSISLKPEKIFFNQVLKENEENYDASSVASEDSVLTNPSSTLKQPQSTNNINKISSQSIEYKCQERSVSSEEFEDSVFIKPSSSLKQPPVAIDKKAKSSQHIEHKYQELFGDSDNDELRDIKFTSKSVILNLESNSNQSENNFRSNNKHAQENKILKVIESSKCSQENNFEDNWHQGRDITRENISQKSKINVSFSNIIEQNTSPSAEQQNHYQVKYSESSNGSHWNVTEISSHEILPIPDLPTPILKDLECACLSEIIQLDLAKDSEIFCCDNNQQNSFSLPVNYSITPQSVDNSLPIVEQLCSNIYIDKEDGAANTNGISKTQSKTIKKSSRIEDINDIPQNNMECEKPTLQNLNAEIITETEKTRLNSLLKPNEYECSNTSISSKPVIISSTTIYPSDFENDFELSSDEESSISSQIDKSDDKSLIILEETEQSKDKESICSISSCLSKANGGQDESQNDTEVYKKLSFTYFQENSKDFQVVSENCSINKLLPTNKSLSPNEKYDMGKTVPNFNSEISEKIGSQNILNECGADKFEGLQHTSVSNECKEETTSKIPNFKELTDEGHNVAYILQPDKQNKEEDKIERFETLQMRKQFNVESLIIVNSEMVNGFKSMADDTYNKSLTQADISFKDDVHDKSNPPKATAENKQKIVISDGLDESSFTAIDSSPLWPIITISDSSLNNEVTKGDMKNENNELKKTSGLGSLKLLDLDKTLPVLKLRNSVNANTGGNKLTNELRHYRRKTNTIKTEEKMATVSYDKEIVTKDVHNNDSNNMLDIEAKIEKKNHFYENNKDSKENQNFRVPIFTPVESMAQTVPMQYDSVNENDKSDLEDNLSIEDELFIDEDLTDISSKEIQRNLLNKCISETAKSENDTSDSSQMSTLLNSSLYKEVLTESLNPIVHDLLQEDLPAASIAPQIKSKRGRKRKSESLSELQPCKRSQRLRAKQIILKDSFNLSKTVIENELSSNQRTHSINIKMSPQPENSLQLGFFRERSVEEDKALENISLLETTARQEYRFENNKTNTISENKIQKEAEILNQNNRNNVDVYQESQGSYNLNHCASNNFIYTNSLQSEFDKNFEKQKESKTLNHNIRSNLGGEQESRRSYNPKEINQTFTISEKNKNFEMFNKNTTSNVDCEQESRRSYNPNECVIYTDSPQLENGKNFEKQKESEMLNQNSNVNDEQGCVVNNFIYTDSPQSPPPFECHNNNRNSGQETVTIIPFERPKQFLPQNDNLKLFDVLINSYKGENQKQVLESISNRELKQKENILKQFREQILLYCYNEMEMDLYCTSTSLINKLLSICPDYNLMQEAVITVAQNAESSNVKEDELPSIIQEMPPRHLSKCMQRLFTFLRIIVTRNSNFCNDLLQKLETLLFNSKQTEYLSLQATLNLTQLYLMSSKVQEYLQTPKHPARLFIAKCLYFYWKKSILMVHEVLSWYPTVLPHREDKTYDRSDALISVIQQILMNTKYDMDNSDLRGKLLISKLRYEYHFEPFKPTLEETINTLVEKLKSSKFYNISLAFGLFCKRIGVSRTQDLVLAQYLMPLANEYYNLALNTNEFDKRIEVLLEIISMIVKPLPIETDTKKYFWQFSRFLNGFDRKVIQEAALCSILRLQRFNVEYCYSLLCNFQPTYNLNTHTQAMLKSFLYRRPLNFWRNLKSKNLIIN